MRPIDIQLESTRRNEILCLTVATGLHILALIWNPILLKSDFKAVHDFVDVTIEEPAGGSPASPEPAAKSSIFRTLKDMLLTPKSEEIAHVAPQVAMKPVAAPQPTLKEATRRPMQMNFMPQSQSEDLAALKNPDEIKAPGPKLPNMPVGGPTLQSKSFGGIRPKDLPFQVSGPDSIATADSSNIPIAVGNNSAKSGLGYTGPTLTEASKRRVGIVPGQSGTGAPNDTMALASAGPAPIAVGTGGNGTAPTGAPSGPTLQQRGGGFGGGHGGFGGGRGSGIGTGFGSGAEGMPGAARDLDSQLAQTGAASKSAKHKGFEIAGPLMNRGISYKVIPQYPAWAEEQGIMGSVRLYFTVDASGNVRPNIRVTKTTGYPALDQLGIDALKQWKFAPLSSGDSETGQWGIITFNFSLSS